MAKIDKIFNSIDFDNNGIITISEFITASIDRKKFLSVERLKETFHVFDLDNSGKIDIFEFIKMFYKHGVDNETWKFLFT